MKRVCYIWTFILMLQSVEILADCHNYNYQTKCNFENLSEPVLHPVLSKRWTITLIDVTKSFIPKLRKDLFNLQGVEVTHLAITDSRMAEIDSAALINLPDLFTLDLSNNRLEVFNRTTFSNNLYLRYLNLSRNCITEVKLRVFEKLSKLVCLNLSRNSISKLDLGFAIGLKSLHTLDLSFNRLSVLDSNVFYNTPMLQTLRLHNNFLTNVPITDLKYYTNLTSISIYDNNIVCLDLPDLSKELNVSNVVEDKGASKGIFYGDFCNVSTTTEIIFESDIAEGNFSHRKAFVNSTLYKMFGELFGVQKEKLGVLKEINAKMPVGSDSKESLLEEMAVQETAILNVLKTRLISKRRRNNKNIQRKVPTKMQNNFRAF